MNKKGFTLAELLGVIVIIGLLLLLIIPLIINGVKSRENKVEETQNNIIFEAVGEYLDLDKDKYPNIPGSVYCVSIKELKDTGILVDPVKKIVEDGNYDDNYTIEVIITKEGTRKYSVSEGECKPYKSKNIEIVISPSNSKWSREKEVTIYYPETCGGEYTCTYKKDNGGVVTVPNGNSVKIKFDKDGTIEATMKGKTEIEKKEKVEKIDIVNPVIKKVELVSPWTMDYKQQVNITLTDAHSGVGGYCVKTTPTKPSKDDPCFKTVRFPAYGGVGTVTEFLSIGKYYIFAKDRVGNVGGYNPNNPNDPNNKNLTFEVKDTTPPTCTITATGTLGDNGWYRSNVDIKLNTSDDYSGVRSYDLTRSSRPTYSNNNKLTQTTDTSGTTYYGYVEDKAGNKNTCQLTIKRDTTPPNVQTSTNMNTNNNLTIKAQDEGSGLDSYVVTTSPSAPSSGWTNLSGNNKQITLTKTNGTYYVYVKDKAGQVTKIGPIEVYVECSSTNANYSDYGSCSTSCGWGERYRTITYNDSKTGKVCRTESEKDPNGCPNNPPCVSVEIVNFSNIACPDDQNKTTRKECTKSSEPQNLLKVDNVSVSGTTVTMHIRLHMNVYGITQDWEYGNRTLCIAKKGSSTCYDTIYNFSIASSNWTTLGGNPYDDYYSVDISDYDAGDYQVIVAGPAAPFRFTQNYQATIFTVKRGW